MKSDYDSKESFFSFMEKYYQSTSTQQTSKAKQLTTIEYQNNNNENILLKIWFEKYQQECHQQQQQLLIEQKEIDIYNSNNAIININIKEKFSSSSFKILLENIQNFPLKYNFTIKDQLLDKNMLQNLLQFLLDIKRNILSIKLKNNQLTQEIIEQVEKNIQFHPKLYFENQLIELNIKNNKIGDNGCKLFSSFFNQVVNTNLKILKLDDVGLTDNGIHDLSLIFKFCYNLNTFSIKNNKITSQGFDLLKNQLNLSKNIKLKQFNIQGNELGSNSLNILSEVQNIDFQKINLSNCKINYKSLLNGLESLYSNFRSQDLQILILKDNSIGTKGASFLLAFISKKNAFEKLQIINLSQNKIGNLFMSSYVDFLIYLKQKKKFINCIDLSKNLMDSASLQILTEKQQHVDVKQIINQNKKLILNENFYEPESCQKLQDLFGDLLEIKMQFVKIQRNQMNSANKNYLNNVNEEQYDSIITYNPFQVLNQKWELYIKNMQQQLLSVNPSLQNYISIFTHIIINNIKDQIQNNNSKIIEEIEFFVLLLMHNYYVQKGSLTNFDLEILSELIQYKNNIKNILIISCKLENFNLSNFEQLKAILKTLQLKLQSFIFSNNKLNLESFVFLKFVMLQLKIITLDISHNNLKDQFLEFLLQSKMNNFNQIEKLNVSYNCFNLKGEQILLQIIQQYMLNSLTLDGNSFSDQFFQQLFQNILPKQTNLQILKLNNCGITDQIIQYLVNFISEHKFIKEIYLQNNNFSQNGIKFIQEYFYNNAQNCSLQNLFIKNNQKEIPKFLSHENIKSTSSNHSSFINYQKELKSRLISHNFESAQSTEEKMQIKNEISFQNKQQRWVQEKFNEDSVLSNEINLSQYHVKQFSPSFQILEVPQNLQHFPYQKLKFSSCQKQLIDADHEFSPLNKLKQKKQKHNELNEVDKKVAYFQTQIVEMMQKMFQYQCFQIQKEQEKFNFDAEDLQLQRVDQINAEIKNTTIPFYNEDEGQFFESSITDFLSTSNSIKTSNIQFIQKMFDQNFQLKDLQDKCREFWDTNFILEYEIDQKHKINQLLSQKIEQFQQQICQSCIELDQIESKIKNLLMRDQTPGTLSQVELFYNQKNLILSNLKMANEEKQHYLNEKINTLQPLINQLQKLESLRESRLNFNSELFGNELNDMKQSLKTLKIDKFNKIFNQLEILRQLIVTEKKIQEESQNIYNLEQKILMEFDVLLQQMIQLNIDYNKSRQLSSKSFEDRLNILKVIQVLSNQALIPTQLNQLQIQQLTAEVKEKFKALKPMIEEEDKIRDNLQQTLNILEQNQLELNSLKDESILKQELSNGLQESLEIKEKQEFIRECIRKYNIEIMSYKQQYQHIEEDIKLVTNQGDIHNLKQLVNKKQEIQIAIDDLQSKRQQLLDNIQKKDIEICSNLNSLKEKCACLLKQIFPSNSLYSELFSSQQIQDFRSLQKVRQVITERLNLNQY